MTPGEILQAVLTEAGRHWSDSEWHQVAASFSNDTDAEGHVWIDGEPVEIRPTP